MRAPESDDKRMGRQRDDQQRGDDQLKAAFGRSATPLRPNERPCQRCDDARKHSGQQCGTNVQSGTFTRYPRQG